MRVFAIPPQHTISATQQELLFAALPSRKKEVAQTTPATTQSARNRAQIEPACMKLQMLCPGVTFGKKVGRHPRSQIRQPDVSHISLDLQLLSRPLQHLLPPSPKTPGRFWQQIGLRARRALSADSYGSRSGGHMPSTSHVVNGYPNLIFATPSRSLD